ncbi:MAG: flagellar motor switch protein FliM [Halothiobacillaceae bacterium]|jgi:flagellar motor switch protein FliM|nr:flagellar motor switch protein FliM [Halothiobacillaceae bacterium]MDY0050398.1 flagellar motor switch protein FliM [Halothiobacillaceae bacterium]
MAGADILTQDEIDALLNGVEGGDVETESGVDGADGVRAYDFTSQERIVRGRLPTLEMLNERFARNFRIRLVGMLRRTVEITIEGVRMVKYSEYVHSLYVPTSLTMMHVKPLKGIGLFMMESRLVFSLVDNFFGGSGRHSKIEGRDFTPTELRVIQRVLEMAVDEMEKAWTPLKPIRFEHISHEMNPQLANIVSPSEVVVVCSFRIEVEGGSGLFDLVLPYTMIEPIRDLLDGGLQGDRLEVDERWTRSLKRELGYARLGVTAHLADTQLTLRDILLMKPGDIIPFEMPEHVTLIAEGMPVFHGRWGVYRGAVAVQVEAPIRLEKETLDARPLTGDENG